MAAIGAGAVAYKQHYGDALAAVQETLAIQEAAANVLERELLAQRRSAAEAGFRRLLLSFSASWTLLVLTAAGGLWLVRRGLAEASREVTARRTAEEALRRQTERLRSILSSMGDGVVVLSIDRRVIAINARAQKFVPWHEGDQVSRDWAEQNVFLLDGKTPCPVEQAPMTRAMLGEPSDDAQLMLRARDGTLRTLSINARPIYDGDVLVGSVAVLHDITDRRRVERELQESEQRLRILSNASFEGIAITSGRRIVDVNETLATWIGRPREQLVGTDGLLLLQPYDRSKVMTSNADTGTYEARMPRADGSGRPVEVHETFTTYEGQLVRIAVMRDITDRLQREAVLKEHGELMHTLLLRDDLTGLYNRRGFTEVGGQALRKLARSKLPGCLFFADLDGLKTINDTFGHEVGDAAITTVGKVLATVFRESDVAARIGGDEFAVLALECGPTDIPGVLDRIAARLAEGNRVERRFVLSISIGTALFEPPAPIDLSALMETADRAMYEQKRVSKQRRIAQATKSH